jgi:hypothetical protein
LAQRKKVYDMSIGGWIMMIIVLGGVWGGFIYLLLQVIKRQQD